MTIPTITFGSSLAIAGTYQVYIKQRWADSWGTANAKVKLESVTWSANPSVPTASFSYEYGPALERGTSTPAIRTRLAIEGYWVKILADCPEGTREWIGYVDSVGESNHGQVTYSGSPRATGKQTFACLGVVNVLRYVSMEQSFIDVNNTTSPSVQRCLSPCVFNEVDGDIERLDKTRIDRMISTRQNTKLEGEDSYVHIFDKIYSRNNNGTVEYSTWSTKDIAEHLLDRYSPLNSSGSTSITFKWSAGSLDRLPDSDTPYIDTAGKSLLDCLNELLSAAKMVGFFATVNNSNEVELTTFTYADADVITEDYTISANENQVNLALMVDPATTYATQTNLSSQYNRIRVRGDYRRTIFTGKIKLSVFDDTGHFRPGWDSEIRTRRNDKEAAIIADGSLNYAQKTEKLLQLYDSPEFLSVLGAWIIKTDKDPATGIKIGDELCFRTRVPPVLSISSQPSRHSSIATTQGP